MSYWIFVIKAQDKSPSSFEILELRLRQDQFCGFNKIRERNLWNHVSVDDRVIFYLGGKTTPNYCFAGLATVAKKLNSLPSAMKKRLAHGNPKLGEDQEGFETKDEEIWENPVHVKPLTPYLDFITDKTQKWGAYFQRTMIKISQKDFLFITSMAKSADPLMVLADDPKTTAGATASEAFRKVRIKQAQFRAKILEYWDQRCSVTGCTKVGLLEASHIKPWSHCDDNERMDQQNGLLLTPNLHAAFDAGFISFNDDGTIVISNSLEKQDRDLLNINENMRISPRKIKKEHQTYLEFHRNLKLKKK